VRRNAINKALEVVRGGGLDEVPGSLEAPSHKAIAADLIAIIRLVREDGITYDEARLRMSANKHLIQLLALERMERK
jgi:hypothetical protein